MRPWFRRALGACGALAGACLIVLAVTGWWLAHHYRPGGVVEVAPHRVHVELGGGWIHEAHVGAAVAFQLTAVALLAGAVLALVRRRRSAPVPMGSAALASAGLAVAVAVGILSGQRLRWNQLALWAVTVGGGFEGVWSNAFDDQVRFFLVPGQGEIGPATYRTWVVGHLVAAPVLIGAAGALSWFSLRRATAAEGRGDAAPRSSG